MKKGEQTRQALIAHAANLFNVQGYSGTSISDIMRVSGLEKGGIYNHFPSKEAIAVAAFKYSYRRVRLGFIQAIRATDRSATAGLLTAIGFHMGEFDNPYIVGGCPILNTAVECDDTNPELRVLVQAAIDEWRQILVGLVEQGIANGEFRPTLSPDLFATLLIAALEGALMMSKAAADPAPLRQVIDYWQDYVREQMVVPR